MSSLPSRGKDRRLQWDSQTETHQQRALEWVQARVELVNVGSYGHKVLRTDFRQVCGLDVDELAPLIQDGAGWSLPGWVSVTFSHLMTRNEVDFLIRAIIDVGHNGWRLLPQYTLTCATGPLHHICPNCCRSACTAVTNVSTGPLSPRPVITPVVYCSVVLRPRGTVYCCSALHNLGPTGDFIVRCT
jgi:hypothetical protein